MKKPWEKSDASREPEVKKEFKRIVEEIRFGVTPEIHCWMPGMGGPGIAGVSDFCLVVMGAFVAVEAKGYDSGEKSEPTPLQTLFGRGVEKAGGYFFCIRPNNVHEMKQRLLEIITVQRRTFVRRTFHEAQK